MNDISVPKIIYTDNSGRKRAGRGRGGLKPRLIVIHVQQGMNDLSDYFKGIDADATLWVKQDGTAIRILPDEDCPWTNGTIVSPDLTNKIIVEAKDKGIYINNICLTMELQGFFTEGYTAVQIEAAAKMTAYWCRKWGIPADHTGIVGHYQIDGLSRKNDPGPLFPWINFINRVNQLLVQDSTVINTVLENPDGKEFPETGYWVTNYLPDNTPTHFYDYFKKVDFNHIGYPIGPAYFDNDYGRIIQWFERTRLEAHPENTGTKYEVQEGLLGVEYLNLKNNIQNKS